MARLLRTRRHAGAGVAALALAVTLAACGGSSSGGSGSGSTSAASMSGKQIFLSAGCAGCHTLAAAGANGQGGPDLDSLKPSYAAVVRQVTNGGGAMPSFRGQLTRAEIDKVARFVSSSTH